MSTRLNHSSNQLFDRIQQIYRDIPDTVRLIGVTKTVHPESIRIAYQAGIKDFGESRIQEAIKKQQALPELHDVTWHLIGHLQMNKARKAIEHFDWIHSVDTLKLAQRLNHLAAELGKTPHICLQVKLRPDPDKHGWEIQALTQALEDLEQCSNLKIRGLMVIPPLGLEEWELLNVFESAYTLAEQIRTQIKQANWQTLQMQDLSMGMSQDYPLAIQAGATIVRLGRILFGDRPEVTERSKTD